MLFENLRNKNNHSFIKRATLLFIVLYFSISGLANQMKEIEETWQSNGHTIQYEDHLAILEMSFEFTNVLSLDELAKELFIITYLTQHMPQPDARYFSDIEKVMANSSFSEPIIAKFSEIMTLLNNWETSFNLTDWIQVNTFLYDSTTPIIKFSFLEEPVIIEKSLINENDDHATVKEEPINLINAELKEKEDENLRLEVENQALVNINAVLKNTNTKLAEEVEKYKNLSEYRNQTISGLKATIDRYIEFENQKDSTIRMLENQIKKLEQDIVDNHNHYQNNLQTLENEIHSLELTIQKQQIEMEWLEDSQKQLLERIDQLKALQTINTELIQVKPVHQQSEGANNQKTIVETTFEPPATENQENLTIAEESRPETETEKEGLQATNTEDVKLKEPILKAIVVYENDEKVHTIQHRYNEHGDLVKEVFLDADDQIVGFSETLYDANRRIKEKQTYEGQIMIGKVIIQYDENGRMIRTFNYNQTSLLHYSVYEYDDAIVAKEPVTVKHYSKNQLTAYDENVYNERGQLLQSKQKDPKGTVLSQIIYEYQQDKPIRMTYFQASKQTGFQIFKYSDAGLQVTSEIYDANGKCISQLVFIWDEAP